MWCTVIAMQLSHIVILRFFIRHLLFWFNALLLMHFWFFVYGFFIYRLCTMDFKVCFLQWHRSPHIFGFIFTRRQLRTFKKSCTFLFRCRFFRRFRFSCILFFCLCCSIFIFCIFCQCFLQFTDTLCLTFFFSLTAFLYAKFFSQVTFRLTFHIHIAAITCKRTDSIPHTEHKSEERFLRYKDQRNQ